MESYLYYGKDSALGADAPPKPLYKVVFKDRNDPNPIIYKLSEGDAGPVPVAQAHQHRPVNLQGWCREQDTGQPNEHVPQMPTPNTGRAREQPSGTQQQPPLRTAEAQPGRTQRENTQTRTTNPQDGMVPSERQSVRSVERPRPQPPQQHAAASVELLPARVQTYLDLAYGPSDGLLRRETTESSDAIARGIFQELVFLDKAQRAVLREEIQKRAKWR